MWLKQRGDKAALRVLAEWAAGQEGWPVQPRRAALNDLVDAALASGDAAGKAVAASALGTIAAISAEPPWVLQASVRRSALLRELGRAEHALSAIKGAEARVDGALGRDALVVEKIRVLCDLGEIDAAEAVLDSLAKEHVEHEALPALRELIRDARKQEGR